MLTFPITLLVIFAASSYGSRSEVSSVLVTQDIDDVCSNECDSSDPTNWCGEKRKDQNGKIIQCVQYSKLGDPCVSSCQDEKGENYKWCMTNAVMVDDWWDYCSLPGYTVNKEKCTDECLERGEDYFWCHTKAKWDYCSPQGRVKPVQLSRLGTRCNGECGQYGKDYYWCTKNRDFCTQDACDEYWEYCSLDEKESYMGKQCVSECKFHKSTVGVDYYWCNTQGGKWEYCSPTPKEGVHLSLEKQYDRYGKECLDLCGKKGKDYFWCRQIGGTEYWDYCSPAKKTIYNKACTDSCKRRGQNYFWCHTSSSWDYCSPDKETVRSGASGKFNQVVGKGAVLAALVLLLS